MPRTCRPILSRKFGRLTPLERVGKKYRCRCACGNEILAWTSNLSSGNTTSCGCTSGRHPNNRVAPEPPAVTGARWIPLTRGRFALVDIADYDRVRLTEWHFANGYAYSNRGVLLHRLVMNLAMGAPTRVDHRDGNGLDCRRSNLRYATVLENNRNRKNTNPHGFKGVSRAGAARSTWTRSAKRWRADITVDGKKKCLGVFATPEEAARAYDAAAVQYFKEFARLNFPLET